MTEKVKPVFSGRIINVALEQAALPDGRETTLEIVRHPGGVAIAAVDRQERVCMIRQFRYAVGGWIWELPAGLLEADEIPEVAARRELQEETGINAGNWQEMGAMLSSPGFCDERLQLFLATDLQIGDTAHEENEFIEVHWVALDSAMQMAENGEVQDAKTVVGLFRARALLRKFPEPAPAA